MAILKADHYQETTAKIMMEKMKIQTSRRSTSDDLRVWRRVKDLGFGAFGTVCLATTKSSSSLPPKIAVKTTEVLSSHDHEKTILSKLMGCDSIIRYYGEDSSVMEDGSMQYHLLLEFASKGSLHDRIRENINRKLSETQVGIYTAEILQGLKQMNDSGYVHCDIKPQNILICEDDKAKIADLGMSKRIEDKEDINSGLRGPRGTPIYMAPETMMPLPDKSYEQPPRGGSRDRGRALKYLWSRISLVTSPLKKKKKKLYQPQPPCDVWALGCVVLEMLTGEPLWKKCSPVSALVHLIQLNELGQEGLPALPTGISEAARDFIDKCLIIDSKSRWTVDQLLHHPFIHKAKIQEAARNTLIEEVKQVADYPSPQYRTTDFQFHYPVAIC